MRLVAAKQNAIICKKLCFKSILDPKGIGYVMFFKAPNESVALIVTSYGTGANGSLQLSGMINPSNFLLPLTETITLNSRSSLV
ncbi:hypothetical protein D3C79_243640 [compost metagenome]